MSITKTRNWCIAVHGGAGAMRKMNAEREEGYRAGLKKAVEDGAAILCAGGPAIEASAAAVRHMERSGAFNAGRGSCLNRDGCIEADAAVMCASDASIGAVAAAPDLTNAVDLAEWIRQRSPHCVLAGLGALTFAQESGFDVERHQPPDYKLAHYRRMLVKERAAEPARSAEDLVKLGGTHHQGDTVGAVALDCTGELALAVSTGGLWLKTPGRVGDSPIAGAGFWAEPGVGAAVATGTGEFIIRTLLSRVAVDYLAQGMTAQEAVDNAIVVVSTKFGAGKVGLVLIDARGNVGFAYDTQGMGRVALWDGKAETIVAVTEN